MDLGSAWVADGTRMAAHGARTGVRYLFVDILLDGKALLADLLFDMPQTAL